MTTCKPYLRFCLFLLLFIISMMADAQPPQQADSIARQPNSTLVQAPDSPSDDDFNVFLFVFAATALSLIAGITLAGALVSLAVVLFLILLVGAGILSVSVYMGVIRKSAMAGVRTGVYLVCAIAGAIAGAAAFWIIAQLFDLSVRSEIALLTGTACGVLGGILWAYLLMWMGKKFKNYFYRKYAGGGYGEQ
jgi:hypothetical protein